MRRFLLSTLFIAGFFTYAFSQSIVQFHSSSNWSYSGSGTLISNFTGNSTNHDNSSTGYIKFEVVNTGTIYINSNVSSESNYDFANVIVNGSNYWQQSGTSSWGWNSFLVNQGQIIEFKYTKDSSLSNGNDEQTFQLYSNADSSFYGCTDPAATNYDPSATIDDGSCCYDAPAIDMTIGTWTLSYDWGCSGTLYTLDMNYNTNGTWFNNSFGEYGNWSMCGNNYTHDYSTMYTTVYTGTYSNGVITGTMGNDNGDTGCFTMYMDSSSFYGCTDPTYCNYDPLANIDDGSCVGLAGCMDPLYAEYNSIANCDDGSCNTLITNTLCAEDSPTGLFVDGIIHSRAVINWDNMNSSSCTVDQYRIKYREVGTTSVIQKTMGGPVGSCTYGNQRTDKLLLGLTGNTTYEYQMKAWYCGGGTSSWTAWNTFTTADDCPNVGNFTVSTPLTTRATFTWDDSNGSYDFARIKMRIDSISNPVGSDWFQVGGFGVLYGTYTKNKNGLVAGETYRAQARTFCDPNGGAYNSLAWTALATWTQPTTVRLEGGNAIANLAIYPNPSRDVFNISFNSESIQDLRVRVLNIVGKELIVEDLQQFIGEYTMQIDLTNNSKGIYLLEIETNEGVINKKLVLQ